MVFELQITPGEVTPLSEFTLMYKGQWEKGIVQRKKEMGTDVY